MNRRGFLSAILASGVASYVSTMAGVLMPVRDIWRPAIAEHLITWVDCSVEYMMPLALNRVMGAGALIGNEEVFRPHRLAARIPNNMQAGDTALIGRLPKGARIIRSSVPVYSTEDGMLMTAGPAAGERA